MMKGADQSGLGTDDPILDEKADNVTLAFQALLEYFAGLQTRVVEAARSLRAERVDDVAT